MRRHVSHFHSNQHPSATDPGRRGSVLLIVISLLGLLMLLGFVFFTFASQENINARSFAEAAKGSPSDINYFRLAMEQLLVGSRADEANSALYMGRHSILGNMYGTFRVPRTVQDLPLRRPGDLQPFNGQGITLTMDTTSAPGAGLGAPRVAGGSGPLAYLSINDSPAAWTWQPSLGIAKKTTALRPDMHNDFGGTNPSGTIELPAPDVGYTAPDVNTLFLGYQGPALAVDGAGVITNAPREAVIPSFHLPQLLRNLVTGLPLTTWATDSVRLGKTEAESTATRVLRPHPDHEFVFFDYTTLQPIATKVPRFLHATLDAAILPSSGAFPFVVDDDNAGLPDGNPNEQGLFSQSGVLPLSAAADAYEFDVDNTGTGEREGIWLDLDLPVEETTGGVLVVPLVSFTVRDADGLINLSVHGNLSGERSLTNLDSGIPERDNFGKWLGPDGVPGQVGDDDGNSVSDDESEVGWPLSDDMLFISQSNQGLGPSEVNPLYALNRDPTDPSITPQDLAHLNRFFGKDPQDAFEAANMEWFLLNVGRAEYGTSLAAPGPSPQADITALHSGRNGEKDLLYQALLNPRVITQAGVSTYPMPGHTGFDDNANQFEGEATGLAGGALTGLLGFGHPLDFSGIGRFVQQANPTELLISRNGFPLSRGSWCAFYNYTSPGGTVQWPNTLYNLPFDRDWTRVAQLDEPHEITVEPRLLLAPIDESFEPGEMAYLHDNTTQFGQRLLRLLAFNFEDDPATRAIRQRFTTLSADRKHFAIRNPFGPDGIAGTGDDEPRAWEFNADTDLDGNREFPPQFGVMAYGPGDPFRPELRRLLASEIDGNEPIQIDFRNSTRPVQEMRQMPLGLNGVLELVRLAGQPTDPRTSPLQIRPLTPHPATGLAATAVGSVNLIQYPPQTAAEQEAWARYDRQRLARDIYVMFYTFCGGRDVAGADPVNYATTSNLFDAEGTDTTPGKRAKDRAGTVYHESQLREMAQYAVNLVDAMDRDDVITRFEYDLDLSNGWGLDDDPYTTFDGGAERSEVYGREAATLAFNEAHVFESPYMTMDNKGTEFDDTDPDDTDSETGRFFTYLELFNVAPRDIDFINQEWRILLVSDDGLGADTTNLTELRFLPGTGTIEAGRLFTLGSCSDSTVTDTVGTSVGVGNSYSVFKVDPTSDGTSANFSIPGSEIIPPDGSSLSGIRTLDLIADATTGKFSITTTGNTMRVSGSSPSSVQGAFMNWTNVPNPLAGVEFHLQRRVHPTRAVPAAGPGTEQDDNPWVTVDEIAPNDPAGAVPRFDIELSSTATGPVGKSLPAALLKLTSQQRELVLRSSLVPETQSGVNKLNSIGIDNNNTPLPDSNSLWQPIFNREFTSLGRLLTVSLAGEGPVTEIYNSPAAIRFLVPAGHHVGLDGAPGVAGTDDDGKNGVDDIGELGLGDDVTPLDQSLANRWYRLFGFLQIPPRLHRGTRPELSNPLNVVRTHGQLNPNTFRHPEVFAGWIDDRHTLNLDGLDISANPLYGDRPAFAAGLIRNWWQEFVKSRDGIDGLDSNPVTGAAEDQDPVSQMYLPGMPGSRPFRSATQTVGGNGSTSATMLRTRALNLTSGSLGLFDAWDPAPAAQQTLDWDIAGASGVAADPHVRTRILSKILNNTTNRSNVFMVHVTVGFFEAVEVGVDLDDDTVIDLNAYRIGGEWSGRPRQNGFFIVDRSLAEEAYEEASGSFSKWEETVKFASHPLDE